MSTESLKAHGIRQKLDTDLNLESIEDHPDGVTAGAIEFFQQLFVEELNFNLVTDPAGSLPYGQRIDTEDWSQSSRAETAYILAEAYSFRVVYIELEKLTRTAQRHAVRSMRSEGWAREGEFIAVFHGPESNVWHLVSPYVEEGQELGDGRTVLRRYVIGEGETHRTVSRNLAMMDASRPEPLYERINEAFRLQPVTEKFYEDYKDIRKTIDNHLRDQDLEIEEAKRYSHLLLNRLMFLYFIQKKGWIGGDKEFVRYFIGNYEDADEEECFHNKWLDSLFFEAMNQPQGTTVTSDFPDTVEQTLSELPFLNGGLFQKKQIDEKVDKTEAYLTDETLIQDIIRGFLESYNFTVTEESPFDLDVAVDPAMLGKIYESLIAEEERDEAGIFYTPRVEVDLMCRLALYDHLVTEANDPSENDKKKIQNFLFSSPEEWVAGEQEDAEPLLSLIHDVDIVDPACGSGAFLVGMMQVIMELYRKLGTEPTFELKEQIVRENLNGVDIKDWAVRVAEFRLWLSLVEAEEGLPDAQPVLPNFSFKLHVGDSIVQKVGDEFINLDRIARHATGEIKDQLNELESFKERYFQGETELQEDIDKKQQELLRNHIEQRIADLEEKKEKAGQRDLNGDLTDEAQQEIKSIEVEVEQLQDTVANLERADEEGIFLWDLDFPEVMLNGGFDIVIGNPPYVRQESIIKQDIDPERLETYSSSKISSLQDKYKEELREYVDQKYGFKPGKRSDLYVYFFFKGLELLNEKGRMMYICSNSWLDIGYGGDLQRGLLTESNLEYIIGNRAAKTFEDSDVNTVITLAGNSKRDYSGLTKFVAFNEPFINYDYQKDLAPLFIENSSEEIEEIEIDEETIYVSTHDSLRTIDIKVDSLWRFGDGTTQEVNNESSGNKQERVYSERTGITGGQTSVSGYNNDTSQIKLTGDYDRGKWGKFIDAPKLYYDLWREYREKFTLLDDLEEPDYGLKSGANKFFFVPRPGTENNVFESSMDTSSGKLQLHHKEEDETFYIEPEFWMRPINEIPEKYRSQFEYTYEEGDDTYIPNLILVKNREIQTSPIEPEHLNSVHINIDKSKNELSGMDVLDYIELGERPIWGRNDSPLSQRTSLSSRNPWYSQPSIKTPFVLLTRYINAEFQYHFNPCLFPVTDNFYYLPKISSLKPGLLAGYMNSTLGWFMLEIAGRSWTNTLKFDKYEYQQLPILTGISEEKQEQVGERLEDLMNRDINNVFEELGAYSPDEFTLDGVDSSRYNLDKILLEEVGIETEEEQTEFYKDMIRMVRDRLMRQPDENPSLCETIAEHDPQYDYER
jgi:hypothetical protein